ncbi:lysozyme-like domain-containing protein, partial [Phlyctochytrium arcticum]
STCQRSQIQQLTNQFENSQNNLAFDYCQDIKDGRGFTCGIVGFTTSTRDAFQVIDDYSKDPAYNREFDPYMDRLRELNSTQAESTAGLDGFCNTWYSTAANSSAFRAVQVARADALYYNPSQAIAEKYGVTAPLARGQLYDAAIQHGLEPDPDSMPSMAARVPRPAGMDDATWISAFMTERSRTL